MPYADPEAKRARHREYMRQRYNADPQHKAKQKARSAVGVALRRGKLQKGPCEVCGSIIEVQAHHDDYSKPLDVRWLCLEHHEDHHGGKGFKG